MVSSWCFPIARSGGFELDGPRLGFPDFWVPTAVLEAIKVEVPTADLKELLAALTEVSFNLAVSSNQKLKKTDCEKRLTTSF